MMLIAGGRQIFSLFLLLFAPAQRQNPPTDIIMQAMKIDLDITVGELMTAYPSVVDVFVEKRMLCIGCPAQAFHSIRDAARLYGWDQERLSADLDGAIRSGAPKKKTIKQKDK
jgi:hybrid cluster-associated redox disulfide protein